MKKIVRCLKSAPASSFTRKYIAVILLFSCLTSHAQRWRIIGNEQQLATATSAYTSVATVLENGISVPYVVFTEGGAAKVKKYTGNAWQDVGGSVATGSPTYTRIVADRNGKLFVSYIDVANSSRLAAETYNTTTNVWEPLGGLAANLYVSAASVAYSISSAYNSTPRHQMAFDTANRPLIVYGEGTNLNPNVKRFNGTAWETVGSSPIYTDRAIGVGVGVDSTTNIPYIVYIKLATATSTTGGLVVARFNSTTWDSIPIPNPINGGSASTGATLSIRHTCITFNKTWNPLVSYFNTGNSNKNTVIVYNKATSTWAFSAAISTRDAPNSSLVRSTSGDVYSSFADVISNGSGRSVARVMKLPANATTWTELKNVDATTGIDEPVGNLSIAVAEDSSRPLITYTKTNSSSVVTPIVQLWATDTTQPIVIPPDSVVTTARQVEYLTRGLVAVRTAANRVYVGWRMFGTDSSSIAFNVYRTGTLLNASPITGSTNYTDSTATAEDGAYTIRPVVNGMEQSETAPVTPWSRIYKSLPLQIPAGGTTPDGVAYTYTANDCSVGDVDGDGEYEFFVKWDPSNSKDNSQSGYTGNVYLDCYKMNGTRLWRIDLGRNIRAGAHYTQFMVYDFDGDGKAEMMCKTADATIDGVGMVIGNATADYRNNAGYILDGPEFLTVFNGQTGAAMGYYQLLTCPWGGKQLGR